MLLKTLFKHKSRIAVIASLIIYFTLTYTTNIQEQELVKLDLNKDGIYDESEVTDEQKEFINKMQKDSTGLAPFTLIPFAAFCGMIIFFGLRFIENYMRPNRI